LKLGIKLLARSFWISLWRG